MPNDSLRLVIQLPEREARKFRTFIMTEDDSFIERVAFHILIAMEPYAYVEPEHERIGLILRLSEFGRRGDQTLSELDVDKLRAVTFTQANTVKSVDTVGAWANHFSDDISMLKRHDTVSATFTKEWIFFNAIIRALLDDLRDRLKEAFGSSNT